MSQTKRVSSVRSWAQRVWGSVAGGAPARRRVAKPVSVRLHLEVLEARELLSGAAPDFNGDGYADWAAGLADLRPTGGVYVEYGSSTNQRPSTRIGPESQAFDKSVLEGEPCSSGFLPVPNPMDDLVDGQPAGPVPECEMSAFGNSLAWADFNGDHFDDLAVGAAFETYVIYGSRRGLTVAGYQSFPWGGDPVSFGLRVSHFAAADFNGDGVADLAIGTAGETSNAGAVNVVYGSRSGLTYNGSQRWSQDSRGIEGQAEAGDYFGAALAAGDFNGDGRFDLAVGVPGEDIGRIVDAGAVNVIYGSTTGLTSAGSQLWSQATPGMMGTAEAGDEFGFSLAAGDFNGDGRDDLAVGVPHEGVSVSLSSGCFDIADAGAINVLYGTPYGLLDPGFDFWSQATQGIRGTAETGDLFGYSLATGDLNGDGRDDLAIGVSHEDNGAGVVNVIYGGASGLTTSANQLWYHDSYGGVFDHSFGFAIAIADFDGDGRGSLVSV